MNTIQLHSCGAGCLPDCAAVGKARQAVASRSSSELTVDVHCHAFVPAVELLVADQPARLAEKSAFDRSTGLASVQHNQQYMLPAAAPRLTSLSARLADMDAMGVDIQLISPSPSQYNNWAPPALAEQLVTLQNEAIAGLCAEQPARLLGLGAVSLQHPQLAVKQLDVAVRQLGLRGVEISTCIAGRELSDETFAPFWARAEALGCVVFIHPFGSSLGPRLQQHYLSNLIGQPLETTIALSHLIFSGTLDRHPGLKLLAAHGGGYLPFYPGRSDHGYRLRPEAAGCAKAPSEYLGQIWFDSLVYQPQALRALIAQVGISQVVIGTDYPFDMGSYDLHQLLAELTELTAEQRIALLHGNAARLLGIPLPLNGDAVSSAAVQPNTYHFGKGETLHG
ncbi:amidohydrolase family protein [Vogesella sp. GCM10023246]|uniref:Amidohydrolase family protein n=1 Tax=Vogesella oryzagri TaxID=3160864 RepID=A0ABV1M2X1_9NEIS